MRSVRSAICHFFHICYFIYFFFVVSFLFLQFSYSIGALGHAGDGF